MTKFNTNLLFEKEKEEQGINQSSINCLASLEDFDQSEHKTETFKQRVQSTGKSIDIRKNTE